uniref:Potassium channel tetramerisation-type BTB domain-containing protein n=1 Tax=Aegilops tauschii subsp. strangulata TaxID=200361 RepID=A0A453IT58_AEGTS
MQSPESSSSAAPVLLNIGGTKYATTAETLTQREPDSMLAAMFSGRHTLPQHPTTVRSLDCAPCLSRCDFPAAVGSEAQCGCRGRCSWTGMGSISGTSSIG